MNYEWGKKRKDPAESAGSGKVLQKLQKLQKLGFCNYGRRAGKC